jgi:hypothetical protein
MEAAASGSVSQRHGGHLAVEFFELGDPLGAEQVGAAREDLAELHERGAQLLERQPHLGGRLHAREVGRVLPSEHVARALERAGQAQPAHGVAEAMADEHAQDFVEPAQVARGAEGLDQHARMIDRGPRRFSPAAPRS